MKEQGKIPWLYCAFTPGTLPGAWVGSLVLKLFQQIHCLAFDIYAHAFYQFNPRVGLLNGQRTGNSCRENTEPVSGKHSDILSETREGMRFPDAIPEDNYGILRSTLQAAIILHVSIWSSTPCTIHKPSNHLPRTFTSSNKSNLFHCSLSQTIIFKASCRGDKGLLYRLASFCISRRQCLRYQSGPVTKLTSLKTINKCCIRCCSYSLVFCILQ